MAREYKENFELFQKNARAWTNKYANQESVKKEKIEKIVEMGFSEEEAIVALQKSGWDEAEAVNCLFN